MITTDDTMINDGKWFDFEHGIIYDENIMEDLKKMNIKNYLILLIVLFTLYSTVLLIGAGERGVIMDFGKVRDDTVFTPGIHFIIPYYNTVAKMDVQTQVYETETTAASKDLQDARTKVALNYHVEPTTVNTLYKEVGIGYHEKLIAPAIQEVVKASTAQFNAEELITRRETVKDTIQDGLVNRLHSRGIIVEQISITNFAFGDQFSQAIEQKVTAQQLALKAENDLQRIKIEAEQKVASANGTKLATILEAEGKAREIEIIQQQLKISPDYVTYLATRQWDGHLPQVTGGAIPLVSIPTAK